MSSLTNKTKNNTVKSVADIIACRSASQKRKAPMLTEAIVPAGKYRSVVLAVEDAVSEEGKPAADVTYEFTSSAGKAVEARVRYPLLGFHMNRFVEAMLDAGLPENAPITEAVGIAEDVEIIYPQAGALGKIKARRPAKQAMSSTPKKSATKQNPSVKQQLLSDDEEIDDDDAEFDDFLEEDDE